MKQVDDYIKKHRLIQPGDTIIVGVSGGADSMMLIDYLYKRRFIYEIKLKVAHIHHGVREDADEERDYVVSWCQARNLPVYVHHCHIGELAKSQRMSEEEAGRIERYRFFISLTNEHDKIAVAHHMNDQAETMLMHFLRGAGLSGLGGIQACRDQIIRPLLELPRTAIEAYCLEEGIKYYDDASNFTTLYTRNKIRLECIPYIEKNINPGIVETLSRQGALYQEAEAFVAHYTQQVFQKCVSQKGATLHVAIQILLEEMPYIQKQVIYEVLTQKAQATRDITHTHVHVVKELMLAQTGKCVHLPYQIQVEKSYDQLIVKQLQKEPITNYEYTLQMGINNIEALDIAVHLSEVSIETFKECKENHYTKYLDYDRIKDNLQIRTRQSGDFIALSSGQKKLKKLLIDDKVPREKRDTLPLIACGKEILWLIGSRMNSKYFVTEETSKILEIKIMQKNTQEGLC